MLPPPSDKETSGNRKLAEADERPYSAMQSRGLAFGNFTFWGGPLVTPGCLLFSEKETSTLSGNLFFGNFVNSAKTGTLYKSDPPSNPPMETRKTKREAMQPMREKTAPPPQLGTTSLRRSLHQPSTRSQSKKSEWTLMSASIGGTATKEGVIICNADPEVNAHLELRVKLTGTPLVLKFPFENIGIIDLVRSCRFGLGNGPPP